MALSKKEKILLFLASVVLLGLIVALSMSLTTGFRSNSEKPPLQSSDGSAITITEDDLRAEEESKGSYMPEYLANIESVVLDRLSRAEYAELDSYLKRFYDEYTDGEGAETGLAMSYNEVIDMYRSDLASIRSITDAEDPSINIKDYFYPETLASAFIYSTITAKIDAVLDRSSLILPAVRSGKVLETDMRKVELTNEQTLEAIDDIKGRLPWLNIIGVAQYDFHAFRTDFRITLVCLDNYLWSVARVDCLNDESNDAYLTIEQLKEFEARARASGQSDFDYDAFYQMAA